MGSRVFGPVFGAQEFEFGVWFSTSSQLLGGGREGKGGRGGEGVVNADPYRTGGAYCEQP